MNGLSRVRNTSSQMGPSLDRGQSDEEADGSEKKIARPLLAAKSDKLRAKTGARRHLSRNLTHEQGCEREAASLNKRASSRFEREDARKFSELVLATRGRKATRSPCWQRLTTRRSHPQVPEEWYRPSEHRKRCRRGSHLCYTGCYLASSTWSNPRSQPRYRWCDWFQLRTGRTAASIIRRSLRILEA